MAIVDLVLIGIGLAMDAFAVSICKGLGMKKVNYSHAFIIALFFGGFQALMPLLGWALGIQFSQFITSYAHWITFALLAFIGGKMLWEAFHEKDEEATEGCDCSKFDYKELVMLAIATSIDALAIGVSFAFLQVDILPAITIIGVVTFAISFAGVVIGNHFGSRYEKPAPIVGGIVLIVIGIKIVLEHMSF
ncbi:MAG: manganese efflux pump MntP family protein [Anaerotardibacter sp.]